MGSWDPECENHGQRYTICIEANEHTVFTHLVEKHPLFTKEIGASDWMVFEISQKILDGQFWKGNPYKMMRKLGYQFHVRDGDFSVVLHFTAYPPDYDDKSNPAMEFWITVKKIQPVQSNH